MNGYFQIVSRNNMCTVKLVPPSDGGEPIQREELFEYLSIKNIVFDSKAMVDALSGLSSTMFVPTATEFKFSEGEYARVFVSPDNMSVKVRLIPCYEGGTEMSKEEFMREFSSRGICFGFDNDAIDDFL